MLACEAFPRPQDFILRRRAILILCDGEERPQGLSLSWILFQGEALSAEVQRFMYYDDAKLSTAGIRPVPHRFQLSVVANRRYAGHTREATVRSRTSFLSRLLEVGGDGVSARQPKRTSLHQLNIACHWPSTSRHCTSISSSWISEMSKER